MRSGSRGTEQSAAAGSSTSLVAARIPIGLHHFGYFRAIQRTNEYVRRFGIRHGYSSLKPRLMPKRRIVGDAVQRLGGGRNLGFANQLL